MLSIPICSRIGWSMHHLVHNIFETYSKHCMDIFNRRFSWTRAWYRASHWSFSASKPQILRCMVSRASDAATYFVRSMRIQWPIFQYVMKYVQIHPCVHVTKHIAYNNMAILVLSIYSPISTFFCNKYCSIWPWHWLHDLLRLQMSSSLRERCCAAVSIRTSV